MKLLLENPMNSPLDGKSGIFTDFCNRLVCMQKGIAGMFQPGMIQVSIKIAMELLSAS